MVESRGGRLPYSGRSFRFSRATFANVERPPVILEWSSTILRVGHAEQACPQHIIPSNHDNNSTNMYDEEDWYFVIAPLLAKIWNRLCLDPSSRRVVVVAPSLYVSSTWEASMKQAFWDLSVPAVTITTCLETIPYSMGWKRGLVMHVGIEEVKCLILANGASLYDTFQAVPCGYQKVVSPSNKVQVEWTDSMNTYWLDETNPNSLMMALLKCLETCPTDLKREVVSNLVFCGDGMVLVPDLARRVRNRLVGILNKTAESFSQEPVSDFTVVPPECSHLEPLSSSVAVTSTAPLRPDLVSWMGASVWATLWLRHHDSENDLNVQWTYNPNNNNDSA